MLLSASFRSPCGLSTRNRNVGVKTKDHRTHVGEVKRGKSRVKKKGKKRSTTKEEKKKKKKRDKRCYLVSGAREQGRLVSVTLGES